MSIDWKSRIKYIFPGPEELQKQVKYDTLEAISYVTPYSQAIFLSKWISNLTYIIHKKKNFTMIECCGGLGGNTIQFSKNKNIDNVVTFELNKDRYKLLVHNIKLYKRKHDTDVKAYNNNFFEWYKTKGEIDKYKDICIFVDPPWGDNYKELKDIENKITLNDQENKKYTMVDLIELFIKNKNILSIVMKLPSTYNIDILVNDHYTIKKGNTRYILIDLARLRRNRAIYSH